MKPGDKVKCLPGFAKSDDGPNRGGHGYKEGKEFTIKHLISRNDIAFPTGGDPGVWLHALTLVTREMYYDIY